MSFVVCPLLQSSDRQKPTLRRHVLQRGGSPLGGFADLKELPWEPPQRSGSTLRFVICQ
ncbi:hypothetical protein [Nostoc sp. 106C]|uniref:hypothetical protein n=1 Tax=Nostoc sp. 106C TaxID=1932667 RepID=UPI00141249F0|nr:hypothetical protein [Nostoc sp. 106C]